MSRLFLIYVITAILSAFAGPFALAGDPLRDPRRLANPVRERMARLRDARVVHADYALLKRDFAALRNLTEAQIDEELLKCAGYISRTQAAQSVVNTPIPTTAESVQALRPMGYGRAAVFRCFDGLIDSKGTGTREMPEQRSHKNGLMSLADSIRELVFERAVAMLLRHADYKPGTVASYAVLDLGFDVVYADGYRERAGSILRQAAERANPVGMPDTKTRNAIESIFRRYGLTSDAEVLRYDWMTIDRNNIQIAKDGAVFDFGAMRVIENFVNSPVNPEPALRLPYDTWGLLSPRQEYPDKPLMWAKGLADGWSAGQVDRARIRSEIDDKLKGVESLYFPCEAAAK